jgi:asparagine synthetase B (glutamine-hydrolysing)
MRQLDCGGVSLALRDAVAVRCLRLSGGELWYLSIFEREIDARVARLERLLPDSAPASTATIEALADSLELTDALVAHDGRDALTVARGGCSNFPLYRSTVDGRLRLTTRLPWAQSPLLSRSGLLVALGSALLGGTYAANASLETPHANWRRLRRGCVTTLRLDGTVARERDIEVSGHDMASSEVTAQLEESVRRAFADFTTLQTGVRRSVLELSGGFDSTLAGAAALRNGQQMLGLSIEFPYYEFRFERGVQELVSRALGIERETLDGDELFPYAPTEKSPRFDEPTIFVTGLAHATSVAQHAAARHADVIYMGHGGDSVFGNDLDALEPVPGRFERAAFTGDGWRRAKSTASALADPRWRRRSTGCFVQDAQQDVWIREAFGVTVRTPFTDRGVFRCGRSWSQICVARATRPDKSLLSRALCDLLPAAVTNRRGKVPYDGVWQRAYARHGDCIAATLERSALLLREVGFSPRWLMNRVATLAAGHPASGREVMAGYALAMWFQAWGYTRLDDVRWKD